MRSHDGRVSRQDELEGGRIRIVPDPAQVKPGWKPLQGNRICFVSFFQDKTAFHIEDFQAMPIAFG